MLFRCARLLLEGTGAKLKFPPKGEVRAFGREFWLRSQLRNGILEFVWYFWCWSGRRSIFCYNYSF